MGTSLECTLSGAHSPRPKMEKGLFYPVTSMLGQKLSALSPIHIRRCRLVFKHTTKMLFSLQRPLRMAFANINGFAKAKKSNKFRILSNIFLKACLKKVLKKETPHVFNITYIGVIYLQSVDLICFHV